MRNVRSKRRGAGTTGDLFAPPPVLQALAQAPPVRAPLPRQLWLALDFPALPLFAACAVAGLPLAEHTPLVVAEGTGAQRRVVAANAAAAAAGIRAGQRLSAAAVRAPALMSLPRQPVREALELERLARSALALTPFVSQEPPQALLLEVRGSLALFGGSAALLQRAGSALARAGHAVASALAPTPRAALWLARAAPGSCIDTPAALSSALARLPLAVTGWEVRLLGDCERLGVRTLGEFRRLPREGLARRFTPAVLEVLDEAYGLRAAPRRRHLAPERFHGRLELPAEFDTLAALGPYCDELLLQLERFLAQRAGGVTQLVFRFLHRSPAPTVVRVGRVAAAATRTAWQGLLHERLQRVVLPAPVLALVLRSGPVLPQDANALALPGFTDGAQAGEAAALLDRLRARLGESAVSCTGLVSEHRPEAAYRIMRPEPVPAAAGADPAGLPAGPRPLWLLPAPAPLACRAQRPEHDGPLVLCAGPERIESGWWDAAGVARDYYVARTRRGARLWIFREHGSRRWFLHGVFG